MRDSVRLLMIAATLVLAAGCGTKAEQSAAEPPAASSAAPGVEDEVSITFNDGAEVRPFLMRVARRIDGGFGEPELAQVEEMIRGLDVEEDGQVDFTVLHQGQSGPLTIAVRLLDENAPDIHFLAAPALAAAIQEEINTSAGAHR